MKKKYFITGGTGSFAKKFIEFLISNKVAEKIIIFSRDEFKQMQMKELPFVKNNISRFRFFIGDVRDRDRLDWALQEEIDVVVHTAALKQVPTTEYNPFETVKTNIIGSQNLIEVSLRKNIDKIINISTDKAVSPINLYGATKLTSEKLFISANVFKGKKKCKFSVVRYGNVMGSRGSVIPLFLSQNIENKKYFTVTHKNMTRFNITLAEAAIFVNNCITEMKGGEIFVPKLPSYNILNLVKAINSKKNIIYTGVRSGEKIHEELVSASEFNGIVEKKNKYIIKYPVKNFSNSIKNKTAQHSYNSFDNINYLSVNELKKLISQNYNDFDK
jgi:UDP-N-acetylglucosamine 4,6-dehydratase